MPTPSSRVVATCGVSMSTGHRLDKTLMVGSVGRREVGRSISESLGAPAAAGHLTRRTWRRRCAFAACGARLGRVLDVRQRAVARPRCSICRGELRPRNRAGGAGVGGAEWSRPANPASASSSVPGSSPSSATRSSSRTRPRWRRRVSKATPAAVRAPPSMLLAEDGGDCRVVDSLDARNGRRAAAADIGGISSGPMSKLRPRWDDVRARRAAQGRDPVAEAASPERAVAP